MGKMMLMTMPKEIIACSKDFSNMETGEISHFIVELEIAKQQLLQLWLKMNEEEKI